MNIGRFLQRSAETRPGGVAVRHGTKRWLDYAGLADRVGKTAACLAKAHDVRPGDRVMIVMQNDPEFVSVFWAALWCGASVVPLNAKLHRNEIAALIGQADPRLLVFNEGTSDAATAALGLAGRNADLGIAAGTLAGGCGGYPPLPAPVEREPDDIAWLFFTSGTTGTPKGALLSHRNLDLMASSFIEEVLPLDSGDTLLHAAPMSHGSGMYMIPWVAAGAAQLVPLSGRFDELEIIDLCAQCGRLSFFAAPTMIQRLIRTAIERDRTADLRAGLRCIVYGGGPMLRESAKAASETLPGRLAQIYGQGECPMTITRLPPGDFDRKARDFERRLASVGKPFRRVSIRIDAPNGEGIGEILVKSPLVMRGYADDPEATARTVERGWLRTGDVGCIDDGGYLHLSDRAGTNIYPREVEDVLIRHESVCEVAVLGRASDEWGEDVVACLSLNRGHSLDIDALDALCKDNLAGFKRPKAYFVLPELPKNAYGKIDKQALAGTIRA